MSAREAHGRWQTERIREGGVIVIGLTGGMGAGKSTALRMFRALGARTFSADDAVHRLYQQAEVRGALVGRFGEGVLGAEGTVDRRVLGERLSANTDDLAWVEALVHPRVGGEIARMVSLGADEGVAVCEIPLLFESGLEGLFDLTVAIEAPADLRRARTSGRMRPEVWQLLEERQLSSEGRRERADMVFVNDGDESELRAFVGEVLERARELGEASAAGAAPGDIEGEGA